MKNSLTKDLKKLITICLITVITLHSFMLKIVLFFLMLKKLQTSIIMFSMNTTSDSSLHTQKTHLNASPKTDITHFDMRTHGIYSNPCECGSVYIGLTKRYIENRIKEHINYCKTNSKTIALVTHEDHIFIYRNTKILSYEQNYKEINIKEILL